LAENDKVAERKDELATVRAITLQERATVATLATSVHQTVHVVTRLPDRVSRVLDVPPATKLDHLVVTRSQLIEPPRLLLHNQDAGVRHDHDEVRVSPANRWLVIDDAVVRQASECIEQPSLP
jgi:hypothetical protein